MAMHTDTCSWAATHARSGSSLLQNCDAPAKIQRAMRPPKAAFPPESSFFLFDRGASQRNGLHIYAVYVPNGVCVWASSDTVSIRNFHHCEFFWYSSSRPPAMARMLAVLRLFMHQSNIFFMAFLVRRAIN